LRFFLHRVCLSFLCLFLLFYHHLCASKILDNNFIGNEKVSLTNGEELRDFRLVGFKTSVPPENFAKHQTEIGFLPLGESPCFVMSHVELTGSHAGDFSWLADYANLAWINGEKLLDPFSGRCLGVDGISMLLRRLQKGLKDRGVSDTPLWVDVDKMKQGVVSIQLGGIEDN
jgi:hemolysin activation/secretion protein